MSKLRHNLSDESTRAATVLSSWMKVPGLVPEADLIQRFANKSMRAPPGGSNDAIVVD